MTLWLLYLTLDGDFNTEYPFHFAFKENCDKVGKEMVQKYGYEKYKCVKEIRE